MNRWQTVFGLIVGYLIVTTSYLGVCRLTHTTWSIIVLIGLCLLESMLHIAWWFVHWMSPLRGMFGNPDQEIALVRALERELARSLRHDAPLVIVALKGHRGLSRKDIVAFLRTSDIVIQGRNRSMVLLMTETPRDKGQQVLERLVVRFPVHAATIADQSVITPAANLTGFGARHQAQHKTSHTPTLALLGGLQLGLFRAALRIRKGQPPPIYSLTAADIVTVTSSANTNVLRDLTHRVA